MTRDPRAANPHADLRIRRSLLLRCVRAVQGLLAFVALSALVTGLPWSLVHFVGWPLPGHVPTWTEVQSTLLSPMDGQFFLNALAVFVWITWLCFVLAALRSVVDVARGTTWSSARSQGPLRALAATLVSAVVLTLLSNRALAVASVPAVDATFHKSQTIAAVAPATPGPVEQPKTAPATAGLIVDRATPAPSGLVRVVDEVQLPHNGIYDSLWRVAERVYGPGGGDRWPELFQLNRGIEQVDGRSLTHPDMVRPGWKIAAYIPEAAAEQPPAHVPPSSSSPVPTPPEPVVEPRGQQIEPGVELMTGLYVSIGLASAISAVLASRQMRRRRRYRIGSGDRSDLQRPVPPAVNALYAADRARPRDDIELSSVRPHAQLSAAVGARGGQELAVNLASTRGLGLSGPGAAAAARALLLHLLTAQQTSGAFRVLVPAEDLPLIFEDAEIQDLPNAVDVVPSLDAALDEMEACLLTRARQAFDAPQTTSTALILLGRSVPHAERRLQAVLDNGSTVGLAGILLGQWRPGATVVVRADGTVSATSPGQGDELAGARLFNMPAADAADLLALLREAEVDVEAEEHVQASPLEATEAVVSDQRSSTPPDRGQLIVKVFGRFQLMYAQAGNEGRELSSLLTPKHREVLVHLALHPHGVRREVLNEAVWPDSRPPRPYNSFHNTLSVLRRALADATDGSMANAVLNDDGRYRLNDELVDVDLWNFQRYLKGTRSSGVDRVILLQYAVDLYAGDLAEDLLTSWTEPFRESARRDVLDALSALIQEHGETDPATVLVLLERARKLDQYNEGVYQDIMRTQAQLGHYDAVPRTLALLTATLGEIDVEPSPDTRNLAELLRRSVRPRLAPSDRAVAS